MQLFAAEQGKTFMGVISIDGSLVWGASSPIIRDLIDFCIDRCGRADYLVRFETMFEHGYNSIFLEDVTDDQRSEFLSCVKSYIDEGIYDRLGYDREPVLTNLNDLVRMIEKTNPPPEHSHDPVSGETP